MKTIETSDRSSRIGLIGLGVFGALLAGAVAYHYFSRPPQMGADEHAFHTVDALYTAVRNRDVRRLAECEQRLQGYRAAGTLPPGAADSLDDIIRKARAGSWQTAAENLYDFMLAQRREGPIGAKEVKRHTKQTVRK